MTAQAVGKPRAHRASSPAQAVAPAACQTGRPWPLGATLCEGGVNFAVHASCVERVEICLFDPSGTREERRIALPGRTDDVWHGFVPGLGAGQLYGLRVHGPYDPLHGWRCNPYKLLLDPYARAIDRPLRGAAWQYAYPLGHDRRDLHMDTADNAAGAGKCIVVDPYFDWGDDRHPAIPMEDSVFCEVHVRGFTKQMPQVPENLRGTFLGLAAEPAIAHLKRLGVTALELLPVQAFNDERRLIDLGLANYWGYNTIGFFAPEPRYLAGGDVNEFRQMVKALHAAGLEVILDVVYNHSCEGNHLGPTLCFKGIDNRSYYRLTEDHRTTWIHRHGNTLNASHPAMLRLIMTACATGWRRCTSSASASTWRRRSRATRTAGSTTAALSCRVAQDPVLKRVKLIAEPWDLGDHGYQVGGFRGLDEWNGQYRDRVRDYWRGVEGAWRLRRRAVRSADIYGPSQRGPRASVNLVTVPTASRCTTCELQRQAQRGQPEDNRDGESHTAAGTARRGPHRRPRDPAFRERQKRNFLTTCSPRAACRCCWGRRDEPHPGRQQQRLLPGQTGELVRLERRAPQEALIDFTAAVIACARAAGAARQNAWLTGHADEDGRRDIVWFSVWGTEMTEEEWTIPRCAASPRCWTRALPTIPARTPAARCCWCSTPRRGRHLRAARLAGHEESGRCAWTRRRAISRSPAPAGSRPSRSSNWCPIRWPC